MKVSRRKYGRRWEEKREGREPSLERERHLRVGSASPQRVLVILLAAMGDAVNVLPMLRRLRALCPTARIEMLTGPRALPILEGLPELDEILTVDMYAAPLSAIGTLGRLMRQVAAREYDVVIDTEQYSALTGWVTLRSGARRRIGFSTPGKQVDDAYTDVVPYEVRRHESHCYLDLLTPLFGVQLDHDRLVPVPVTEQEKRRAETLLQEKGVGEGLLVALHPLSGQTATSRRWSEASFVELGRLLVERYGAQVLLVGSPEERSMLEKMRERLGAGSFVTAGETTLRGLAALLARVDAFVGNDSGPMHLAAAMGARTVGLFGPNTPLKWGPLGAHNRAVSANLPCSPCISVAHGAFKPCANPRCMTEIRVEHVLDALELAGIVPKGDRVR